MEKLTTQHSLYSISSDELKEFQASYAKLKYTLPSILAKIMNIDDCLATVLNLWIIIKRHPEFPIKTTDKSASYICNDYIHDLLNHSADITRIIQRWKNDENRLFIFSYYLTLHTLQWIDFVLISENEEIAAAIFKATQRRSYYVYNPDYLPPISKQAMDMRQRLVKALLIRDNNLTKRMDQIIEKSIDETELMFQLTSTQLVQQ